MLEFARWKYFLVLTLLLLSALYALPNIYLKEPSVQVSVNRGGEVDQALLDQVNTLLNEVGIHPRSVAQEADNLVVRLHSLDEQTLANDVLRRQLGQNYTVALNLASTVPDWLATLGGKPMVLGLDLVGGVHFALQVDRQTAVDKRLDSFAEDMRSTLRENRINYRSVERRGQNEIQVVLSNSSDSTRARDELFKTQPNFDYLINAERITVNIPANEMAQITKGAIEQNLTTLRNRVNGLGVAEPLIQRQGEDRIVVELPGVQDTAQAKRMIGATASLEYRLLVEGDAYDALQTGRVPPQARLYRDRNGAPVLLNKRVIVTGDQMVAASVTSDQNNQPAVSITLNNAGGQRMFDVTSQNVGKPMAVVYTERIPQVTVVDGQEQRSFKISEEVISIATINGVFGKNFITSGLTKNEADNLSKLLKSGSLAAPMDFVEEYVIGPSLGAENVARGVTAVLYAFLFTLLFFMVYYRMFGIITCVALVFNLLIVVAVMSLFGATMSLPGFAGLALSIGLSVDANVLINERIREELRAGMPPKPAIVTGYEKASDTILDSNLTGIIAGLALYAFGTGPLKGFAITLVIGIIASMFTAIVVSRAIVTLLYAPRKKLKSLAI